MPERAREVSERGVNSCDRQGRMTDMATKYRLTSAIQSLAVARGGSIAPLDALRLDKSRETDGKAAGAHPMSLRPAKATSWRAPIARGIPNALRLSPEKR